MNDNESIAHDVSVSLSMMLSQLVAGCGTLTTNEVYTLVYPAVRKAVRAAIALSQGEHLPGVSEE